MSTAENLLPQKPEIKLTVGPAGILRNNEELIDFVALVSGEEVWPRQYYSQFGEKSGTMIDIMIVAPDTIAADPGNFTLLAAFKEDGIIKFE